MENLLFTGISLDELLLRIERIVEAKLSTLGRNEDKEVEYFSRQEVCTLLKISLPTLHDWTKVGRLKSYKIGNRVLYKTSEVKEAVSKGVFQTYLKLKP